MTNVHSTLDEAFKHGSVKRGKIKLQHTAQCDGHELSFREHVTYLIYTYTKDGDERSILFASEPPFEEWSSFHLPKSLTYLSVLGVAWDIQRNTAVLLMKEPNEVKQEHPDMFLGRGIVKGLNPGGSQ